MDTLRTVFLCFMAYSFLGWLCETVYCSVPKRKFVNRGFLNGPLCPVYGFGALLVIVLLDPRAQSIPLLFAGGLVFTSALEYITSVILEKLFHIKLWDYSGKLLNINGRVCLKNSMLFGVLSVLLMRLIHPFVRDVLARLPQAATDWISAGILLVLAADIVVSVRTVVQLGGKLAELERLFDEIREKNRAYKEMLLQSLEEKRESVREQQSERLEALRARIRLATAKHHALQKNSHLLQRRFLNAFPNAKSIRFPEAMKRLKGAVKNLRKGR